MEKKVQQIDVVDFMKKMEESEKEFRLQFDPQSKTFHNGFKKLVDLGGKRIPESMPTEFKENDKETIEIKDFGKKYNEIFATREFLTNIKKLIAKLTIYTEEIFREKNTKRKEKKTKSLENLHKELKKVEDYFLNIENYKEKLGKPMENLIVNSQKNFNSQEEFSDFNFEAQRFMNKIFIEMNVLLKELKIIKKEVIEQKRAEIKIENGEKQENN